MKQVFILLIALFTFSFVSAQQVQKTLLKTFSLNGNQEVTLDFDGDVVLEEWDNDNMLRVQMEIIYHNSSEGMLKHLISKGRYHLQMKDTEQGLVVNSPNRKQSVVISKAGETLRETVNYKVFVPRNVVATVVDNTTTSIEFSKSDLK